MNRKVGDTPGPVEADSESAYNKKLEQDTLRKGIAAEMLDDPDRLGGRRAIGGAALNALYGHAEAQKRREEIDRLQRASYAVRDHLLELEQLSNEVAAKEAEYREKAAAKQRELDDHYELMEEGQDLLKAHKRGKGDPQVMKAYLEKRGNYVPDNANEDAIFMMLAEQMRQDQLRADELAKETEHLNGIADKYGKLKDAVDLERELVDQQLSQGVDPGVALEQSSTRTSSLRQKAMDLEGASSDLTANDLEEAANSGRLELSETTELNSDLDLSMDM